MRIFDAITETFQTAEFQGRPALFTTLRIDRSTLPEGIERYEIRHSDTCGYEPVQLARDILANHLGTLLTNAPVQLTPDGYLDISSKDLKFNANPKISLEDFQRINPPKEREVYEVVHSVQDERDWFYNDIRHAFFRGYLGTMVGHFGVDAEIHTNFMPGPGRRSCTQGLSEESEKVITWLHGKSAPLYSAREMARFCVRFSHTSMLARGVYGFRVDTPKHVYYMRCLPERDTFEIRCYERKKQRAFAL